MTKAEKWWQNNPDTQRQGIGVVLHWKPTGWAVHRTLEGSPAAKAGIQKGDHIHSINGHELGATDDIKEVFLVATKSSVNLDNGLWTHKIQRNGNKQIHLIKPAILRALIEEEERVSEESSTEYCFSCYECYQETDGWYECGPGGCSGRCYLA